MERWKKHRASARLDRLPRWREREQKLIVRKLQKIYPHWNRIVYGKRYVLPSYRQPDYYSQEESDRFFSASLLTPLQTDNRDDVMFAAFSKFEPKFGSGIAQAMDSEVTRAIDEIAIFLGFPFHPLRYPFLVVSNSNGQSWN
jgi:hypothetical protein